MIYCIRNFQNHFHNAFETSIEACFKTFFETFFETIVEIFFIYNICERFRTDYWRSFWRKKNRYILKRMSMLLKETSVSRHFSKTFLEAFSKIPIKSIFQNFLETSLLQVLWYIFKKNVFTILFAKRFRTNLERSFLLCFELILKMSYLALKRDFQHML